MAVHSTICMPYLVHYGTKEQQDRYIPAMTAGDCVASVGMTEPDAGSDLQGRVVDENFLNKKVD